jgi:hypothetical protein
VVQADTLFRAGPNCLTWPMAANVVVLWPGLREIGFRCSRCGKEEMVRVKTVRGNDNAKPETTMHR